MLKVGAVFYHMPTRLLSIYAQARPLHRLTEEIAHADMDYLTAIKKALRQAPRYFVNKTWHKVRGAAK